MMIIRNYTLKLSIWKSNFKKVNYQHNQRNNIEVQGIPSNVAD